MIEGIWDQGNCVAKIGENGVIEIDEVQEAGPLAYYTSLRAWVVDTTGTKTLWKEVPKHLVTVSHRRV